MQQEQLRFVVTNDPSLDFDLIQEAWIGNQQVADVRQVNGAWKVTFFPQGQFCELSWKAFTEIYLAFSKFIVEKTVK